MKTASMTVSRFVRLGVQFNLDADAEDNSFDLVPNAIRRDGEVRLSEVESVHTMSEALAATDADDHRVFATLEEALDHLMDHRHELIKGNIVIVAGTRMLKNGISYLFTVRTQEVAGSDLIVSAIEMVGTCWSPRYRMATLN